MLNKIIEVLEEYSSFIILAHSKPDGDTVGGELALYSELKKRGKKVKIYSKYAVPEVYSFLPEIDRIQVADKVKEKFDVAIVLECNNLDRAGNIISDKNYSVLINIDHHQGFEFFGHINWINKEAAAICEMIYEILTFDKREIDYNEALYLYVGIITDTGALQQGNVTPWTFEIISRLLKAHKLDIENIRHVIYHNFKPKVLKFLGKVLLSLELLDNGRIASLEIKKTDYNEFSTSDEDIEGFIDYGRKIKGVRVSCLFREAPNKTRQEIKVSFRSDGTLDMNNFSANWGGGGHLRAAGCTIPGAMEEVKKIIVEALIKALNENK